MNNKYNFANHVNSKLANLSKNINSIVHKILSIDITKKKFLLLASSIAISVISMGQQTVTLQSCHQSADSLFPIKFKQQRYAEISELNEQNLSAKYLPSIDLNAKINYQSKVTSVPIAIPGVLDAPTVPNEQYGASLDIGQLIYDGGAIKASKKANQLQAKASMQQVKVDMYKIKEQINQYYFTTLLLQENRKVIELMKQNISERKKVLKSSVDNGVVNASELDNLEAELIKIEQQLIEIDSKNMQVKNALTELSCQNINSSSKFELPKVIKTVDESTFRPEHQLFNDQSEILDANIQIASTQRMPKISAFGSAGFGYPGLNMFSEEMEPYYIVGAQITWKVWDWKQTRRQKETLTIQKQLITDTEDTYNRNLNIQINQVVVAANQLEQLISTDEKIIEIRKRISTRSASQLENGTKTSADYINDLNAEKQARINLTSRQIQLIQAQLNYLSLLGKPLFNN